MNQLSIFLIIFTLSITNTNAQDLIGLQIDNYAIHIGNPNYHRYINNYQTAIGKYDKPKKSMIELILSKEMILYTPKGKAITLIQGYGKLLL